MPSAPSDPIRARLLKRQGRAIKAARLSAGHTQLSAGESVGAKEETFATWERGERQAPEAIRRRIAAEWDGDAKALGVDTERCPHCGRAY